MTTEFRVLLLTFTDQGKLGFSGHGGIDLNCSTDVDANWYSSLLRIFPHTLRFDIYSKANHHGIAATNEALVAFVETYRPEYIVYPCNFSGIITPDTLMLLRQMGSIIIGFFFDDDVYFEQFSRWMIPYLDYCVTHALRRVDDYKNAGARCLFSPAIPISPTIFCKLNHVARDLGATFVGGLHANRREYLKQIASCNSVPVRHLGGGAENKMDMSQMVMSFNRSHVNLNFSLNTNLRHAFRQIKGRIFEIPLCGGFLLTEYAEDLEKYFKIGTEIEVFESPKDAAEKISYFLANPEKREEIALNGYERALTEYSGENILRSVFCRIAHDIEEHGRPAVVLIAQKHTTLSQADAEQYFRWVTALIRSREPLRSEWLKTLDLVLRADPDHVDAHRLKRKYSIWGDPAPLLGRVRMIGFSIVDFSKLLRHYIVTFTQLLVREPSSLPGVIRDTLKRFLQ